MKLILIRFLVVIFFFAETNGFADTRIILGENASAVQQTAARDLKADILKAYPRENVFIEVYPGNSDSVFSGNTISLDKVDRYEFIHLKEVLEPETFLLQTAPVGPTFEGTHLVIMAVDDRGLLYGVYEFSKEVLGIDALEYWTGKKLIEGAEFTIPDLFYREGPPVFKLRGYRDTNSGLLANWKEPKLIVEFDIWKEMIDSLARLRYNYIDIHGLLSRPEYYLQEEYQALDYHTDLRLVEQVIDYAHSKGLLVQVPMNLSWEFKHLELDEVCITTHFDRWMDIYSYYLADTPLGKGDLFLARPRHPFLEQAYNCPKEEALGISSGPLLEVVFSGLGKLIQKYRPGGQLICELSHEGRELWTEGQFSPRREVQILWADKGSGQFDAWPIRKRAYSFGVSLQAGQRINQVVQNPYPERIQKTLQEAAKREMTENGLVNGPNFKPFILNVEASARIMWDPDSFDRDVYFLEWTTGYFGSDASPLSVKSLQLLHDAHTYASGFQETTRKSHELLMNLKRRETETVDVASTRTALALARRSLEFAIEAQAMVPETSRDIFDDQIVFPCRIFIQNLELLRSLIEFNNAYRGGVSNASTRKHLEFLGKNTREKLLDLRAALETGSRWKKWRNWTHPENFPLHTAPPDLKTIDAILEVL